MLGRGSEKSGRREDGDEEDCINMNRSGRMTAYESQPNRG